MAEKDGYQRFRFHVANIAPQSSATMTFMYYQPLSIDMGMGKYWYPLQEGGTDERAQQFWLQNDQVEQEIVFDVLIKSAWPITGVRTPGYAGSVKQISEQEQRYTYRGAGSLHEDFVLYYRLADNLPGRVEMMTYKPEKDRPGTFMMVVTPGLDLQPLPQGADYLFVLDNSGSMQSKLHTLVEGVRQSITNLQAEDRFRVIVFNSSASELTPGWVSATDEAVIEFSEELKTIQANGGTNIYEGLQLALADLDDDRATSVVLVTDGVTNKGIVDPQQFHDLMGKYDVRVFGYLMGNSSNWPLMRVITEQSGGFYRAVSNSDDIIGEILLSKNKILYECLHDADLRVRGINTSHISGFRGGKVYRGEQLVMWGKYYDEGSARVELEATLTGADKVYQTDIAFPAVSQEHPEIERLWALSQVEAIEFAEMIGEQSSQECREAIADIGVAYQIVTDETSMIVMDDTAFQRHQIERKNRVRLQNEGQAQQLRQQEGVVSNRVDTERPMFSRDAARPSNGGGGGALGPWWLVIGFIFWGVYYGSFIPKKKDRESV